MMVMDRMYSSINDDAVVNGICDGGDDVVADDDNNNDNTINDNDDDNDVDDINEG